MKANAWRRIATRGDTRILCLGFMSIGLALTGLCAGCQDENATPMANNPDGAPVPAAMEHPLLKGIPIPAGFQLVQDRSRARHQGATREAQCEFQGSLVPGEVVRFYEHYMPTAGFGLGPKIFVQGQYTLRFESTAEECNIVVKRTGFNTTLVIDIGPASRGEPPPRSSRVEPTPP